MTHREASIGGQELKAVLHVNELPLDGPVVAAKVVERGIQLLQSRTKHQLSFHSLGPQACSMCQAKPRSFFAWIGGRMIKGNRKSGRDIFSDMQMSPKKGRVLALPA